MRRAILAFITVPFLCSAAQAVPFTINAQLAGDARPSSPDNIVVDVTVTGDTTSSVVLWTVSLAGMGSLYPNATLKEFGFNMSGGSSAYVLSGFNPGDWEVKLNSKIQGAGGNSSFTFLDNDTKPGTGGTKPPNVTPDLDLTFSMTKLGGAFLVDDFLLAVFTPTDAAAAAGWDGGTQLAAHVGSLVNGASGAAVGNYRDGERPANPVPEPATLLLLGSGLLGLSGVARRRAH